MAFTVVNKLGNNFPAHVCVCVANITSGGDFLHIRIPNESKTLCLCLPNAFECTAGGLQFCSYILFIGVWFDPYDDATLKHCNVQKHLDRSSSVWCTIPLGQIKKQELKWNTNKNIFALPCPVDLNKNVEWQAQFCVKYGDAWCIWYTQIANSVATMTLWLLCQTFRVQNNLIASIQEQSYQGAYVWVVFAGSSSCTLLRQMQITTPEICHFNLKCSRKINASSE